MISTILIFFFYVWRKVSRMVTFGTTFIVCDESEILYRRETATHMYLVFVVEIKQNSLLSVEINFLDRAFVAFRETFGTVQLTKPYGSVFVGPVELRWPGVTRLDGGCGKRTPRKASPVLSFAFFTTFVLLLGYTWVEWVGGRAAFPWSLGGSKTALSAGIGSGRRFSIQCNKTLLCAPLEAHQRTSLNTKR